MAGQNSTRREVLEAMVLASAAALIPGFQRWSCAQQMQMQHAPPASPISPVAGVYAPVFFTLGEFALVEHIADLILPSDGDSPGAKAAGAAEFVDFWVSEDFSLQQPFANGIAHLQALSRKQGARDFLALEAPAQNGLLSRLAYRQHYRPGDEAARSFFALLRKYVVIGFYTSEAGFKALDSPFLTFYAKSPGCPHPEEFHGPAIGAGAR